MKQHPLKSINIRVSGIASTKIPIVVLGNSPITESYVKKVDFLKTSGVIQGFWSLNPKPTNSDYVVNRPKSGFQTILDREQLFNNCKELITNDMNYFSSMISKLKLGEIIRIASQEKTDVAKAEKFLRFLGVPLSGRAIRYKSSLRCGLSTSIPNVIKNAA
jgi:hypothetical protein